MQKDLKELHVVFENQPSQDDLFWFEALSERLPKFENQVVVDYFRSDEARQEGSLARTFIESALIYIVSLGGDDAARVLFPAITLGGTTLTKYLRVLLDFELKERRTISTKLSELL